MRKWERELRKLAKEYRFKLSGGGKRHFRFTRKGCATVYSSATPSCHRNLMNVRKQLERSREGIPV